MGAHALEELAKPFEFVAMATMGCFVGHIFMYPLGLFELSGQAGAAVSEIFNFAADPAALDASALSTGAEFTESGYALDAASGAESFEVAEADSLVHEAGDDGVFTRGESGFEDCVTGGGSTHFHGTDMVCHPSQ